MSKCNYTGQGLRWVLLFACFWVVCSNLDTIQEKQDRIEAMLGLHIDYYPDPIEPELPWKPPELPPMQDCVESVYGDSVVLEQPLIEIDYALDTSFEYVYAIPPSFNDMIWGAIYFVIASYNAECLTQSGWSSIYMFDTIPVENTKEIHNDER